MDASNSCIPPNCNLVGQIPPLPKPERGVPLVLDGNSGRRNVGAGPILLYPSRQFVIARNLQTGKSFVYRGHTANVTVAKFSPSGAYVASADVRGKLRVWSWDHQEHLCKLDIVALSGPIRDLSWDLDSQRIVVVGEGSPSDPSSLCARVLQWDTGVKLGDLGQHARKKASSCTFRPCRPMRIVTGGSEDFKCSFNKGPPFQKVWEGERGIPHENVHRRGSVHCVRYNRDGTMVASVGTDRTVAFYNGLTLELLQKMEHVHDASIYSCAFHPNASQLLTCSADGTVKLMEETKEGLQQVTHSWNIAEYLRSSSSSSVDHRDGHDTHNNNDNLDQKVPLGGMVMGCTFVHESQSGDMSTLPVAVALNGKICVLSKSSGGGKDDCVSYSLAGHQAPISALAVHHQENKMYTCDSDGVIVQWDLSNVMTDGEKKHGHILAVDNVQHGSVVGGGAAAATNTTTNTTTEEEGEGKGSLDKTLMNKIHAGAVTGMSLVASCSTSNCHLDELDSTMLLSVGWDDFVRTTVDRTTNTLKLKLAAQPNAIATGSHLAVILTVQGLQLMRHGKFVSDHILLPFEASSVCVSADDSTIYVGGCDSNVHLYKVLDVDNFLTLEESHQLSHTNGQPIYSLAISHNGTKLASAGVREICVWDMESNYEPIIGRSRWCFHQQRINALAWSQDDSILASGGNDDSINFWSLCKKTTRVHYPHAHRGGVTAIEFLKNVSGAVLVSVGNDACINLWDVTDDLMQKFG